jgi:hypothetical protein
MFAALLVTAIAACVGASLSAWLAGSLTAGLAPAPLERSSASSEGHCSQQRTMQAAAAAAAKMAVFQEGALEN